MNKARDKLNSIDRALRDRQSVEMEKGTKTVILRIVGFELFNNRPYHNYETWSDGYNVIGKIDGSALNADELVEAVTAKRDKEWRTKYLVGSGEDLDDAVESFLSKLEAHRLAA